MLNLVISYLITSATAKTLQKVAKALKGAKEVKDIEGDVTEEATCAHLGPWKPSSECIKENNVEHID